jgi:hypothetical protein
MIVRGLAARDGRNCADLRAQQQAPNFALARLGAKRYKTLIVDLFGSSIVCHRADARSVPASSKASLAPAKEFGG